VAHSPAALPSARAKAGPVAPVAPASSAAAVEIDLDEPLEAPAPVAAPSRKAAKVEPKAEPVPALAEPAPSLAEEVTSLQAARAALAAGEAEKAIALLDGHQRRFPQGALRVEAEMVRIEALARAGDARGAASRARRFAEEHPDTPYSRRARAMVGDAGAGE
jgi:TolA-binding protein